ncbi:ATP-binding protein [Streptomyces sp. NPDC037389]|uniref:sensor histidine kinase n=1 Tax=Streptomyces sp. NPDC037389 TaxID=3155369 RepID=UPI0033EC9B46
MLITILPAVSAALVALAHATTAFLAPAASRGRLRRMLDPLAVAAATVSLGVTALMVAGVAHGVLGITGGTYGTFEALLLLGASVPTVRTAPLPVAVTSGAFVHLAVSTMVLRDWSQDSVRGVVGGCLFWSITATCAVVGSAYLRVLDDRRRASVAGARRDQRLELAGDLHDFVAHDVSEIVALAQAARFVVAQNPHAAADALARIEDAGQRALRSMDRTVHMLRADETDGVPRHSAQSLDDLPGLVERFAGTTSARVRLAIAADTGAVRREAAATAYRVVVEALTNVRRHAPDAREVGVTVAMSAGTLTVEVVDDGIEQRVSSGRAERRGGLGLPGLAERLESLGGTLRVGSREGGGWRLAAELPIADTVDAAESMARR